MKTTCYDCASEWCVLKGSSGRACTGYTKKTVAYTNDTSTGFDPDAYKYTSTQTVPDGEPYKKEPQQETIP